MTALPTNLALVGEDLARATLRDVRRSLRRRRRRDARDHPSRVLVVTATAAVANGWLFNETPTAAAPCRLWRPGAERRGARSTLLDRPAAPRQRTDLSALVETAERRRLPHAHRIQRRVRADLQARPAGHMGHRRPPRPRHDARRESSATSRRRRGRSRQTARTAQSPSWRTTPSISSCPGGPTSLVVRLRDGSSEIADGPSLPAHQSESTASDRNPESEKDAIACPRDPPAPAPSPAEQVLERIAAGLRVARKRTGLSEQQVVALLAQQGLAITVRTLRRWETERPHPRRLGLAPRRRVRHDARQPRRPPRLQPQSVGRPSAKRHPGSW